MKNLSIKSQQKEKVQIIKAEHLYLHIPFCKTFCSYCDFYKTYKDEQNFEIFFETLKKDIELNKKYAKKLKSIYFGGGTPNLLNFLQLEKVVNIIKAHFSIHSKYEWTIECNPDLINDEQIKHFIRLGINRISLGIQTTNENVLKKVARNVKFQNIENAAKLLIANNFDNYSFDFIYNLPNQTFEDINQDLEFIKSYKPKHVSWYGLILKNNTGLKKQKHKIDQEKDFYYFEHLNESLLKDGYTRYEVSSYCISKKYQSVHNLGYWQNKCFLGIGPSAASFLYDKNYFLKKNNANLNSFEIYKKNNLNLKDYYFQTLMMGLRQINGIKINQNTQKIIDYYRNTFDSLIKSKQLKLTSGFLKVNSKYINNLHDILLKFL